MAGLAARLDESMPVGNEGAGVVIKAGSSAAAPSAQRQDGGHDAAARCMPSTACSKVAECLAAARRAPPRRDGASCFVNPLTSLGMTETMRREGHKALVHTAAASNLGQMLNKICLKDGIGLVNIVRNAEQAKLLRDIGAKHVVDSTAATFTADLTAGAGRDRRHHRLRRHRRRQAGRPDPQRAWRRRSTRRRRGYSRYGSTVHKQVYIYGGLDTRPTELSRGFGMAWGIGGWLLFPFLQKVGAETGAKLRQRVVAELKTTFACALRKVVSLARSAATGQPRRLQQARHRREVFDQPEQVRRSGIVHDNARACPARFFCLMRFRRSNRPDADVIGAALSPRAASRHERRSRVRRNHHDEIRRAAVLRRDPCRHLARQRRPCDRCRADGRPTRKPWSTSTRRA